MDVEYDRVRRLPAGMRQPGKTVARTEHLEILRFQSRTGKCHGALRGGRNPLQVAGHEQPGQSSHFPVGSASGRQRQSVRPRWGNDPVRVNATALAPYSRPPVKGVLPLPEGCPGLMLTLRNSRTNKKKRRHGAILAGFAATADLGGQIVSPRPLVPYATMIAAQNNRFRLILPSR